MMNPTYLFMLEKTESVLSNASPFSRLDTASYYKVEVYRKIKDPNRKLLEFGRIFIIFQ